MDKTEIFDAGAFPDEDEIRASELAYQADVEMMYKILESDDALNLVVEENKRLNLLNAHLNVRIRGLMNEKNECIKQIKMVERQKDWYRRKFQATQKQ